MRYRRVLLLFPNYEHSHFGALRPPTGIGYLAESLRRRGIKHAVLDMSLGCGRRKLLQAIGQFNPDLLAISMMSFRYNSTYKLIDDLKERYPDLTVAAGGPHISTLREQALAECAGLDLGFALEGDNSLPELCLGKELKAIEGLIYRDNGEIIYTGDRPFIRNLDDLPFPTYEKFELGKYVTPDIEIVTSRGCPQRCIFCPVKTVIGHQFRARSAANVADELEYWHQKGKRHFGIVDDNFSLYKERVYELCDEIERRGLFDLELRCGNGIRADKVDFELLARMQQVGFKYLSFGVESGNDKVLKNIKKGEDIETVKTAVRAACKLGFEVTLFFIVGSPGERWRDLEDSVQIALSNPVFDAKFYNLIPFPRTELFEWVSAQKLFLVKPSVYLDQASHWDDEPVFETSEMPRDVRVRALKYTKKVRKRVRRRAIVRRLSRFGVLANLLANLFVFDISQHWLMHNRFLRRFASSFYERVRI